MSSVEEMTGEMKRLILKCRSLESKLEQTVPKKTYQEAVQKLQAVIDKLNEDLTRATEELLKTETLGGRINSMSAQLASLASQVSHQGELLKTETEKKTVPKDLYAQSVAKIAELEAKNSSSVPREDFDAAQARIIELERKLSESVPKGQFTKLMDEISGILSVRDSSQIFQFEEEQIAADAGLVKLSDFVPTIAAEQPENQMLEVH
jgi:hypothetical protein